ncbi:MAG: hypothetical protein J6K03_01225 [Oscillospiraceae bacterium]|nr:hypothetical protein [Oscillospiraceae bacterium]
MEIVDAYIRRENDRAKKRAVALYNAAALLTNSIGSLFTGGQMKRFSEAFPGFDVEQVESGEMSDEAMYAKVKVLNAIFGGEEES